METYGTYWPFFWRRVAKRGRLAMVPSAPPALIPKIGKQPLIHAISDFSFFFVRPASSKRTTLQRQCIVRPAFSSKMRPYNISSAIHRVRILPPASKIDVNTNGHQILDFQSVFKSPFSFNSFHPISSIAAMDPNITRINSYWFDTDNTKQKWFGSSPELDAEIKSQFSGLISEARASKLTSWTEQPQGTLALLLLLDQFPRNVFRGTRDAFSSDAKALDIAVTAIAKGQHRELPPMQQVFFHLPFTHDERLISQVACVALCEALVPRCESDTENAKFAEASLGSAKNHMDVIMRFGRFPGRNIALGRESTPEEVEFLKDHPFGL